MSPSSNFIEWARKVSGLSDGDFKLAHFWIEAAFKEVDKQVRERSYSKHKGYGVWRGELHPPRIGRFFLELKEKWELKFPNFPD